MDQKKVSSIKPPKVPCGSCPYRRDVPAGLWEKEEYDKLPPYDGETWEQPRQLFMCHQQDGCLCGGWLLAHDLDHLLALRVNGARLDRSIWTYAPNIDVFASGAEAAAHGISGIKAPSLDAKRKITGLVRQRIKRKSA